jgi:hypothetical protein
MIDVSVSFALAGGACVTAVEAQAMGPAVIHHDVVVCMNLPFGGRWVGTGGCWSANLRHICTMKSGLLGGNTSFTLLVADFKMFDEFVPCLFFLLQSFPPIDVLLEDTGFLKRL